MKVPIRWTVKRDLPEIMEIDSASYDAAWTEFDFKTNLGRRNVIGMVAEHDGRIVGFMVYELYRSKIDVTRFAVDPGFRLRGVGRAMAAKLTGKLYPQRRTQVTTVVSEMDLGAHKFLKRMGWKAYAVDRGGFDEGVDAYAFRFTMEQAAVEMIGGVACGVE